MALAAAFAVVHMAIGDTQRVELEAGGVKKGYNIKSTGLMPIYPDGFSCSPLTSLYASWVDVDGSHRDEIHSGVDGGRLNEWIVAPGPGSVRAVWEADWQWGREGALVLVHTADELEMSDGPPLYYSVYDHLRWEDIQHLEPGQKIRRGEKLAQVYRPGGHQHFLPEVHFEVWEVQQDQLTWVTNKYGGREWRNTSARLIDPLYLMGVNDPPEDGQSVTVVPFEATRRYRAFSRFTYMLRVPKGVMGR